MRSSKEHFSIVDLERQVRERTKELNCLYHIGRLSQQHPLTVNTYIEKVVELLPTSWQHTAITVARVKLYNKEYRSKTFRRGKWRLQAPIILGDHQIGIVEVHYLKEKPEAYEGPFLKEERYLIDEVAKRIGETVNRILIEEELRKTNENLEQERQALKETNDALRALIGRIKNEELEIKAFIESNVRENLLPILDATELDPLLSKNTHLKQLRKSLERITSPFTHSLKKKHPLLTPTEVQISKMIRNGMRSKDIADIRKVSLSTVHRHRENIRRKLGLQGRGISLAVALQDY